jgi:hypothetical protein
MTNLDYDKDDEVSDRADSIHEEKDDDVQLGKKYAREKKYHALVGGALNAASLTMPQASAVGNALLQRALEAASDAYDRIRERERRGWTYSVWLEKQPDGMPIPARKAKRAFMVGTAANDNLALTSARASTDAAA